MSDPVYPLLCDSVMVSIYPRVTVLIMRGYLAPSLSVTAHCHLQGT